MEPTLPRTTIGVFDSGVGGLSILAELLKALPECDWVYIADSGFAPYGERPDDFVRNRSLHLAHTLIEKRQCHSVVIACNTATAIAAPAIRSNWPQIPIIGVEPGIKPAAQRTRNGKIGVLATAATLGSSRYRTLVMSYAAQAQLTEQACAGLALAIENGELASPEISALLDIYCRPLAEAGVDTVVLGCTHYSFVKEQIAQRFPAGTQIIDTAQAVAQQARRISAERARALNSYTEESTAQALNDAHGIRLLSSDSPERLLHIMRAWIQTDLPLISSKALS